MFSDTVGDAVILKACELPWVKERIESGRMKMAMYREDELNPRYRHHPLITSIPGSLSEMAAQTALAKAPASRTDTIFRLPPEVRREYAYDVIEMFVPADSHIKAARQLVEILRNSYKRKDPSSAEFMKEICRTDNEIRPPVAHEDWVRNGPDGGAIVYGSTGSGKSSTIDRFEQYIGPYGRIHTAFGGRACLWASIPILKINVAGLHTPKQVAFAIADALDDKLGGHRMRDQMSRGTNYVAQLSRMLKSNLVGMLIVDDVQLWGRVDCRPRVAMLSLLVGLVESDICVVCVGTISLLEVLERHTSLGEKLMALEQIPIPPVTRGKEMQELCQALWQRRTACPRLEVMPSWLPTEVEQSTAGLRRHIRELFIGLFQQMVDDDLSSISRKYVQDFARSHLSAIAPAIAIINQAYKGQLIDRRFLKKYEEYIDGDTYKQAVAHREDVIARFKNRRVQRQRTTRSSKD